MYNRNYKTGYSVKKVVRSFRDLEVYQTTLGASVIVVKDIKPKLAKLKYPLVVGLTDCAMTIPLLISEAHSIRFGDHKQGLLLLERAMAGCNKMIVYLEQAKGIYRPAPDIERPCPEVEPALSAKSQVPEGTKGQGRLSRAEQHRHRDGKSRKSFLTDDDRDLIDDLVRRYAEVRTKIFHLEKSWQKWTEPRK